MSYHVTPNLNGKIIINIAPLCMDKEQAKMLFGLVWVEVRFPKYLPEGYECTEYLLNTIAASYYSNEQIRSDEEYVPKCPNSGLIRDNGGLIVKVSRELLHNINGYLEERYEYMKSI